MSVIDSPDCTDLLDELRDTLLRNARGVFQWAKIWLNILLAVEDTDRMAITSETDARQWLDRLRNDSRESATDYELLTSGYQRLWDITCIRERHDFKQRARLFHFVLAANRPSTIQMLSTALRICNNKFDRSPQPEAIMRLCSDFLFLNTAGFLEFVHSSALNFIRDLNMMQDKLAEGDEEKFFSDHRNHESVARLYMDLIGSATHPYWTKVGIEMKKWNDLTHVRAEGHTVMKNLLVLGNEGHAPDGILAAYFMIHGLTHFPKAARKRSLDDPIWKDFIQRLVLPFNSVFGAFLLSDSDSWFSDSLVGSKRQHNDSRCCLHWEGRNPILLFFNGPATDLHSVGRLRILPSHILACLPVFDEYDRVSSTSTSDTAGAHDCVELLKDMFTLGGNFDHIIRDPRTLRFGHYSIPRAANALHLACSFENAGAVHAILSAAKLLSPNSLSEMLRSRTREDDPPLGIAITCQNVTIASILLEADRQPVSENTETGGLDGLSSTYTSSQWALDIAGFFGHRPILDHAVRLFEEKQMLSLLKVARPENINAKYWEDQTLLHLAVKYEKYVLARTLVQIYGADKTTTRMDGKTPFELGTRDEDSVLGEHS